MLKKLTILVASCIMTVPIVAAAAPPVKSNQLTAEQREIIMERMSRDCEEAYYAFRFTHDGGKRLEQINQSYPEEYRGALVMICYGFGKGFEARRSIV